MCSLGKYATYSLDIIVSICQTEKQVQKGKATS